MQRKISLKQIIVCIIGFLVITGMLLFGIKEDMVVNMAALFIGAGILLIAVKESTWLIYYRLYTVL